MKQSIFILFIASIFLISFSINVSAETFVYDDFSGPELDLSKWFFETELDPYAEGHPDEYYVDTALQNYHVKQNTQSNRQLLVSMSRILQPGETLEYDVDYVSGDGNRVTTFHINYVPNGRSLGYYMSEQYGCSYCGFIGFWNSPGSIGNDFGLYHFKIEFVDDFMRVHVTKPDSSVWTTVIYGNQTSLEAPYKFTFESRTGHNGIMHFDYDNFVIIANGEEPSGEYEVDDNTIALWHFNEGNGTIAYDETGVNHGTINGAVWDMNCFYGKCLNFDGEDDYIAVPDDDSLTFYEGNFTIEAWFKLS
ncbi:MAG: hypothetical protein ABH873_03300, partial [Candidatus Firestonebacteria bacterium]